MSTRESTEFIPTIFEKRSNSLTSSYDLPRTHEAPRARARNHNQPHLATASDGVRCGHRRCLRLGIRRGLALQQARRGGGRKPASSHGKAPPSSCYSSRLVSPSCPPPSPLLALLERVPDLFTTEVLARLHPHGPRALPTGVARVSSGGCSVLRPGQWAAFPEEKASIALTPGP